MLSHLHSISEPSQAKRRWLLTLITLLLMLVSAGCGLFESNTEQPLSAGHPDPAFVLTVPLEPLDTPTDIEERFGGRLVVWERGHYALLALAADSAVGGIVEANLDAFLTGAEAAWMNGSSSVWAGGSSSVWAGGSSSVWAGGSSSVWAGGVYTWMPENTGTWQQIGLQEMHQLAPNLGYGITVAVIDTGVDLNHPALREALAPAGLWWDFYGGDAIPREQGRIGNVGYGHGTNVAGIIRQIAPRATILPLRVLGPDGAGNLHDVAAAIDWAVEKGAHVINLSLGSDSYSEAVDAAIRFATSKGVLVVASSGNTEDTNVTYPASSAADEAEGWQRLSVTSVGPDDVKSDFATFGPSVELAAPGEQVYGPAPEEQMANWSGTSMSAPMASAALALALAETLIVPASDLAYKVMVYSADIYTNSLNDPYTDLIGAGRLDLFRFLNGVLDQAAR